MSFLISWHAPIHHMIRMPSNGQKFFLNLCFLGNPFFITIISLNNLIIIIIIIIIIIFTVIIPYFYLLLCHKPIRNMLQREKVIPHCLIAHFLSYKVIRDIPQHVWIFLTAFLHISWDLKWSGTWYSTHGSSLTASLHIPCVWRWSGIYFSLHGLWATASLQISCILKRSETNAKKCGSMCTTSLHISCVLRWSGTTIIKCQILSFLIFIYILRTGEVKIYPKVVIYWFKNVSGSQKQLPLTSTFFLFFLIFWHAPIPPF